MTRIAFIGLGIMGLPMAVNLAHAGFDVVGFNRSPARAERLAGSGARAATSVAEACAGAQVVVTMLPDSPDVESVVAGDGGVFAHAPAGALWIDTSTISPATARSLARAAAEAGLRAVDAPVSGGEQGAIDATLSIMVGGDGKAFAAAADVLCAVGRTIVHVGPSGAGQTVKAANQLIVAANIVALAEAIGLLHAEGVDLDAALTVLGGGLAGSKVLDQKAAKMVTGDFEPGFRLRLHDKDLGIMTESARRAGAFIPVGALVAQLVGAAVARGDGDLDHSALFRQIRPSSRTADDLGR